MKTITGIFNEAIPQAEVLLHLANKYRLTEYPIPTERPKMKPIYDWWPLILASLICIAIWTYVLLR